jgi:O-antigen/teichoic acid export membrane protein
VEQYSYFDRHDGNFVNKRLYQTNALFNLAGGASSACMVLILPYLLNRLLSQQDYAIWVLGFQAVLYVPMLGLGIHQILNRTIAHSLAVGDVSQLQRQLGSGFLLVLLLALVAGALVWVSSPYVGLLSGASSGADQQISVVWRTIGSGASVGLLSLFFFGCFGGQQRYEWENAYKAMISLGFLLVVWWADRQAFTLTPLALALAYVMVIGAALTLLVWRFFYSDAFSLQMLKQWHFPTVKSYLHSMYGYGVWQIGILMVSGLDLWIVARVNFAAVPGYAIALSFLVFLTGSISAITGPCLPLFATHLAKADHSAFTAYFLVWQKRLLVLVAVLCALLWMTPNIFWQFLLQDSAPIFTQVFPILLLASCLRLITLLYSLAILSANLQHRIVLSPLVEGLVNVACSVLLGLYMGVIGVALGTVLGAMLCLALHALYNIPRTVDKIPLTPKALIAPWTL